MILFLSFGLAAFLLTFFRVHSEFYISFYKPFEISFSFFTKKDKSHFV